MNLFMLLFYPSSLIFSCICSFFLRPASLPTVHSSVIPVLSFLFFLLLSVSRPPFSLYSYFFLSFITFLPSLNPSVLFLQSILLLFDFIMRRFMSSVHPFLCNFPLILFSIHPSFYSCQLPSVCFPRSFLSSFLSFYLLSFYSSIHPPVQISTSPSYLPFFFPSVSLSFGPLLPSIVFCSSFLSIFLPTIRPSLRCFFQLSIDNFFSFFHPSVHTQTRNCSVVTWIRCDCLHQSGAELTPSLSDSPTVAVSCFNSSTFKTAQTKTARWVEDDGSVWLRVSPCLEAWPGRNGTCSSSCLLNPHAVDTVACASTHTHTHTL